MGYRLLSNVLNINEHVDSLHPAGQDDNIIIQGTGTSLTITNYQGIYIRDASGNPQYFGTQTTLSGINVNQLDVQLNKGGDDTVGDVTLLNATIDGGPGDDIIMALGPYNPVLTTLFNQKGVNRASLLPNIPVKILSGDAGNDFLVGGVSVVNHLYGGPGMTQSTRWAPSSISPSGKASSLRGPARIRSSPTTWARTSSSRSVMASRTKSLTPSPAGTCSWWIRSTVSRPGSRSRAPADGQKT